MFLGIERGTKRVGARISNANIFSPLSFILRLIRSIQSGLCNRETPHHNDNVVCRWLEGDTESRCMTHFFTAPSSLTSRSVFMCDIHDSSTFSSSTSHCAKCLKIRSSNVKRRVKYKIHCPPSPPPEEHVEHFVDRHTEISTLDFISFQ